MRPERDEHLESRPSPETSGGRSRALVVGRGVIAVIFIAAGINHFVAPAFYESIVPPILPRPDLMVVVSGVAEVLGGAGLLVARLRRAAAWGLIALLIAVYPANIFMALNPELPPQVRFPEWSLWARLPIQFVMIWLVWLMGIRRRAGSEG